MERWISKAAWMLILVLSVTAPVGSAEKSRPAASTAATEIVGKGADEQPGAGSGRSLLRPYGESVCSDVFPGRASVSGLIQSTEADKTAVHPDQPPRPLASVVILNDGIETEWPANIWTVTYGTGAAKVTWDDTNYIHHGGSWSAWCARGGPDGLDPSKYYYAKNMNAWATYGPFSLADATDASWSFWHWTDTQDTQDTFRYMVSTDGTNFHGYQVSGRIRSWAQRTIDLKNVYNLGNVCGQPKVWVAFVFRSNDDATVYDGTFIDDIRIEKTTSGSQFDLVALDVFPADSSGVELPTPYHIAPGQQIYLCFRWQCIGTGTTPSFRTEIWLDGQRTAYADGTADGGFTYRTKTTNPWTATVGSHSLEGRLDVNSAVAESNETNNIRTESSCFSVTAGPIIRISPTGLDFSVSSRSGPVVSASARSAAGVNTGSDVDFTTADRLPDRRILVWLAPSPAVDLVALQKAIRAVGGEVLSLAPEGRIFVAADPSIASKLTLVRGVESVSPSVTKDLGWTDLDGGAVPGMGARPPTPEEEEYIRRTFDVVDRIEPTTLSLQRALLQGRKMAPASVDNSVSQYFPPIRSQGTQGSCTAWSVCYYYSTYLQARDENLTVSTGNNDLICAPGFIYNLMNGGMNTGTNVALAFGRLGTVGCCNWTLMPYSQDDWVSWPSEAAWIDALKRRTLASHSFDLTADAGIAALKQHLANGNLAVTDTDVYSNWHPTFHNNEGRGIQNGVLFSHSGETYKGGHAMTFVGYDDNRSYNNGSTTRYGAFLIANSWGGGWGTYNSTGSGTNKGFMWVSYDYIKNTAKCFDYALYSDDRDNYRPRFYAVGGLNHAKRGYVTYSGGIGSTLTPAWSSSTVISQDGGTTESLQDTKRIAVDLTDGIPSITDYTNISLFVRYSISGSAVTNGTITSAQAFQDFDGDGSFQAASSTDPPVTVAPGQSGYARVTFAVTNPNAKTFAIYNDGTANLSVTDITSRDHDAWLSWSPDPNPGPALTIPPGGSQVIVVTIDPTRTGYSRNEDQLLVHSNDSDKSPYPNAVFVTLSKPSTVAGVKVWHLYP